MIATIHHERGIPSKRESSAHIDYVPALCTHRPSHLPIEWLGEASGFWSNTLTGVWLEESVQTSSFRGRWSRNKVTVGEPAVGSFYHYIHINTVNPKSRPWRSVIADLGQDFGVANVHACIASLRCFPLTIQPKHNLPPLRDWTNKLYVLPTLLVDHAGY